MFFPRVMTDLNASTGVLLVRRLTDSCKDNQVLGQVAAGELFASPEVSKALSGLEQHVDKKKLEELKGE
jgi:hypothetical protein